MKWLELRDSQNELTAIIRGKVEIAWDGVNGAVLRTFHNPLDDSDFSSVWLYDTHFEVF